MMKYCRVALIIGVVGAMLLPSTSIFAQTETPYIPAEPVNPASVVPSPSAITTPVTQALGSDAAIKSLLFSDSDITAIRSARLFYEQHRNGVVNGGIAEDDFLRNLEKITTLQADTGPKTFTYPQFFHQLLIMHQIIGLSGLIVKKLIRIAVLALVA